MKTKRIPRINLLPPADSQVYKGPPDWQQQGYEVLTPPANYNKDQKNSVQLSSLPLLIKRISQMSPTLTPKSMKDLLLMSHVI